MDKTNNEIKLYLKIGEILKQERQNKGYSQSKLADRIGYSRNCIANWESGRRTISIYELIKVCNVLNIDAYKIIKIIE